MLACRFDNSGASVAKWAHRSKESPGWFGPVMKFLPCKYLVFDVYQADAKIAAVLQHPELLTMGIAYTY